jgi:hypothetical protein
MIEPFLANAVWSILYFWPNPFPLASQHLIISSDVAALRAVFAMKVASWTNSNSLLRSLESTTSAAPIASLAAGGRLAWRYATLSASGEC